jgi:hypothetical protein
VGEPIEILETIDLLYRTALEPGQFALQKS